MNSNTEISEQNYRERKGPGSSPTKNRNKNRNGFGSKKGFEQLAHNAISVLDIRGCDNISKDTIKKVTTTVVKNGELFAVFNQERYPFHHDTGQTVTTKSKDGGITWSEPKVVVPWTQNKGSWDC